MNKTLKTCIALFVLLVAIFYLAFFLCSVRLRVVNEGESTIKNIVLQGKGIGRVIYEIPPHGFRAVLIRPALETDLRFEYSSGEKTYNGLIDEYFTKDCSGKITLVLNSHNGDYNWQGWVRSYCFGHQLFVSNSSTASPNGR